MEGDNFELKMSDELYNEMKEQKFSFEEITACDGIEDNDAIFELQLDHDEQSMRNF